MKRYQCLPVLHAGRAIDASGWPAPLASVCESCPGCESLTGELGMVGDGVELRSVDAGQRLTISWCCPACGIDVSETTSHLESLAAARSVNADPLCWRCRPVALDKVPVQSSAVPLAFQIP
ncbi:hypothetical protein ACI77O_12250 [Pseudomonas tritici]|uniref:hypothetical protein n=1 Tax=Pseudomonas tritici TaxID=2745518 RepID=UPI00387AC153